MSNISGKLGTMFKKAGSKIGQGLDAAAGAAYQVSGAVEGEVNRRGGVGKALSHAAKTTVANAAAGIAQMNADVVAQGGYKAALTNFAQAAEKKLDTYQTSACTYLQNNVLTPDGSPDTTKLKAILADKAQAVKAFGARAVDRLEVIAKEGVGAVKADYRAMMPTPQEMETKYAGIGAAYTGLLFRPDFEACLTLSEKAGAAIPASVKAKKQILEDIKASASGNLTELREFYAGVKSNQAGTDAALAAATKLEYVNKYLAAKRGPQ